MEAPADPPERVVPVEADAVLAREGPVQAGSPVQRQLGVALPELRAREFQRLVQLVQPLQRVVQPEQPPVFQAVIPLFLVERFEQCPQLPHRELPGVHFQVQHAPMHRHTHRNLGRGGLQIAECIAQVDLPLCQQGRHALFQKGVDHFFVVGAVLGGIAVPAGLQVGSQQPRGPLFGPGIPQQATRGRGKGCHFFLPVQKLGVGRDGSHPGRVQIKLHHRFQRNLIQQQPLRILDGHVPAQLRQDKTAKIRCILCREKQAAAA